MVLVVWVRGHQTTKTTQATRPQEEVALTAIRWLIVIFGPPLLVGGSYWLTLAHSEDGQAATLVRRAFGDTPPSAPQLDAIPLQAACRQKAAALRSRLSPECRVLVRVPYVLAGDLSEEQLERHYRETIVPTARALSICYFDRSPNEPITILLFSNDRAYRRYAQQIDGQRQCCYSGYYVRQDRRIVLNIATGGGTLAHELTHALAHFDFPKMPEWFDEGLASLYEESEFTEDGLRLKGVPNWRGSYLTPAIRSKTLRPLASLIESKGVRRETEGLDYAFARYLCLYLQHRGLLAPFYRKFRAAENDPTGLPTLRTLLDVDSLDDVDRDFRAWVLSLDPSDR